MYFFEKSGFSGRPRCSQTANKPSKFSEIFKIVKNGHFFDHFGRPPEFIWQVGRGNSEKWPNSRKLGQFADQLKWPIFDESSKKVKFRRPSKSSEFGHFGPPDPVLRVPKWPFGEILPGGTHGSEAQNWVFPIGNDHFLTHFWPPNLRVLEPSGRQGRSSGIIWVHFLAGPGQGAKFDEISVIPRIPSRGPESPFLGSEQQFFRWNLLLDLRIDRSRGLKRPFWPRSTVTQKWHNKTLCKNAKFVNFWNFFWTVFDGNAKRHNKTLCNLTLLKKWSKNFQNFTKFAEGFVVSNGAQRLGESCRRQFWAPAEKFLALKIGAGLNFISISY